VTDTAGNHIDEGIAAGPAVLLLSNNGSVALRTKAGALLRASTLGEFFDPVRDRSANPFGIRTLYDQRSQRFFAVAAERGGGANCSSQPGTCYSRLLLAVSRSHSPGSLTGADWHFFSLDATTDNGVRTEMWADYPSLAVTPDSVVIAMQMFPFTPPGVEPTADSKVLKIRILDKSRILEGLASPHAIS